MSIKKRLIAEVKNSFRNQGINWLILEQDEKTGGWFLYGHQDLDKGSNFDSWNLHRKEAEDEAATQWGVMQQDWKIFPLIDP